ncbi:MAG TPA: cation transporter [Thermoanaerobaculia bacterium]|nr:cation transporter [Thermoanaerobaculia bacterium]
MPATGSQSAAGGSRSVARWRRIGRRLVAVTMAYNAVEAVLAVGAGVVASSIALVGFGLDSVIELAAASVLFWRLGLEDRGAPAAEVERGERRVLRFVGGTFLALATYVTAQSLWMLWQRTAPDESPLGIALAVVSLLVMPLVAWGKLRAAREVGSSALRAEARETLACSYLSAALLAGLAANALAGWWWADPAAALLMVPWLVREGLEGLSGDPCDDE